jgi:hypothetical protein
MKKRKFKARSNQKLKRRSANTGRGFRYANGIPQPLAKSLWAN